MPMREPAPEARRRPTNVAPPFTLEARVAERSTPIRSFPVDVSPDRVIETLDDLLTNTEEDCGEEFRSLRLRRAIEAARKLLADLKRVPAPPRAPDSFRSNLDQPQLYGHPRSRGRSAEAPAGHEKGANGALGGGKPNGGGDARRDQRRGERARSAAGPDQSRRRLRHTKT